MTRPYRRCGRSPQEQTRIDFAVAAELPLELGRVWPDGNLRALQVAGFDSCGNCIACGAPFLLSLTGFPTCSSGHRQWVGPLEERDVKRAELLASVGRHAGRS